MKVTLPPMAKVEAKKAERAERREQAAIDRRFKTAGRRAEQAQKKAAAEQARLSADVKAILVPRCPCCVENH